MDPLREEYIDADTSLRCPHCRARAWFPRPKALAATILCPSKECGQPFVWDRRVSSETGLDRALYLHPRVPGLLESMFERSWEIFGVAVCLLVFAVPLVRVSIASAVYFTAVSAAAVGLGVFQRRVNRLNADSRTETRSHVLGRAPTIRAVGAAGWVPTRQLAPR